MLLHGNIVSSFGNYSSIRDDIEAKEIYPYNGVHVVYNCNTVSVDNCDDEQQCTSYYKYVDGEWEWKSEWDKTQGFDSIRPYHDQIIDYYTNTSSIRRSLNMPDYITVGLVSKPGMGKSTLIRMLATTLGITDIYSVVDGPVDLTSVSGIVIVEDYDRFLDKDAHIDALNSLSYTGNRIDMIIYTSNSNLDGIVSPDLLFDFGSHTYDTYARSVAIVGFDNNITDILYDAKISMREANNILVNAITVDPIDREKYIRDSMGTIMLSTDIKYGKEIEYVYDDDWL